MNVILAAGGTGGHMVPAHALAAELKARGHGVGLVTDARGAKIPALFEDVEETHGELCQARSHQQVHQRQAGAEGGLQPPAQLHGHDRVEAEGGEAVLAMSVDSAVPDTVMRAISAEIGAVEGRRISLA